MSFTESRNGAERGKDNSLLISNPGGSRSSGLPTERSGNIHLNTWEIHSLTVSLGQKQTPA